MSEDNRFNELGMTEYTYESGRIYAGRAIVESVTLAAEGADGYCQIYDGEDANGKQKAHLTALSGTTVNWQPGRGARFDRGIYIAVNAVTTKVSITYTPVSDKAVK